MIGARPMGAGAIMGWSVARADGRLVACATGRVDETTWEAFSADLNGAVREAAAAGVPLVLDLSGLDYMSSRGLRALTLAKREAGEATAITLAAPNDRMREILSISRYDKLFKVIDSVDADV
jgi:anti-sigma B factor antagonist